MLGNRGGLLFPKSLQPLPDTLVTPGENRGRKERRILCSSATDGKGRDRNPSGHLNRREKRIEPAKRAAFHWNAEHRKRGVGCGHTGQMRRHPGTADDDFHTPRLGAFDKTQMALRGPMRGNHQGLVGNAQSVKSISGAFHRVPIGRAPHDDRYFCSRLGHLVFTLSFLVSPYCRSWSGKMDMATPRAAG